MLAISIVGKNDVKASENSVKIAQRDVKNSVVSYLPNGDFQSGGLDFWTNNQGFVLKTEGSNTYLTSTLSEGNIIDTQHMLRNPTDTANVTLEFDSRNSTKGQVILYQYKADGTILGSIHVRVPSSTTWEKSSNNYKVMPDTAYFTISVQSGDEAGTNPGSLDLDNISLYALK